MSRNSNNEVRLSNTPMRLNSTQTYSLNNRLNTLTNPFNSTIADIRDFKNSSNLEHQFTSLAQIDEHHEVENTDSVSDTNSLLFQIPDVQKVDAEVQPNMQTLTSQTTGADNGANSKAERRTRPDKMSFAPHIIDNFTAELEMRVDQQSQHNSENSKKSENKMNSTNLSTSKFSYKMKNPVSVLANITSRSASLSSEEKIAGKVYCIGTEFGLEYDIPSDKWTKWKFDPHSRGFKGILFESLN